MTEDNKTESGKVETTPQTTPPKEAPPAPAEEAKAAPAEEKKVDPFEGYQNPEEETPPKEETPAVTKPAEAEKKPAEGEEAKTEEEPPAEEAKAEEAGEEAKEEEAPVKEEGAEEEPAKEAKKPSSMQERIDALTAKRHEAERKQEKAERDTAYWKEKALAAPVTVKPTEETPKVDPKVAPDSKDPKYKFGETDPDFVRDTAQFYARQEAAIIVEEQRAKDEVAANEKKWDERTKTAREAHPDFDDKVIEGANRNDWACSPTMGNLIKSSPVGAEVAYYLATHADESRAMASLSPVEQARDLGRLEATLTPAETPAEPVAPIQKTTKAPTPPVHRAKGSVGKLKVPADTENFEDFDKAYDKRPS